MGFARESRRPSPPPGGAGRGAAHRRGAAEQALDRREPTLADLAWSIVEHRWMVATIAAMTLLVTAAYLASVPSIYQSSVLIQVGRSRPAGPEEVVRLFDTAQHLEGEKRILQSRPLLESVIDRLGLDVEARPRTLPIVGAAVRRRLEGAALEPARFGQTWSTGPGERIRVDQLAVGDALLEAPLALVAMGGGRYQLTIPGSGVRLSGAVGEPAGDGAGERRVSLIVSDLRASPGTEFVLRKLRRDDVVDELQRSLIVTEQGKDSGLVELSLKGTDSRRVANTVETIATSYVRQGLADGAAEAANALRVLDQQIPALQAKADAAEAAVDRFHRRNSMVNLSVDGQRLVLRVTDVERAIAQAETAVSEQARRHTAQYPEAADAAKDLPRLQTERAALEAQLDALPALELEYARLVRQVAVTTEKYTRVANRAEALRTAKSSWGGNARVIEHAVERRRPVSPKKGLALALSMVVGLAGGVVTAFLRSAFDPAIRDPDEIEASTGVPVFATIPRSAAQRRVARRGGRRKRLRALAFVDPADTAVEELRALRSGVQFALRRAASNVVVVSSPAPSSGKSFVSVNFAHLLAAIDGRVLLIDGDLRRGVLHRYFGVDEGPGVTNILLGEVTFEQAVHPSEDANLDVLTMGKAVTNPGELVASAAFRQLLEDVRARYKTVIVDTTPILSVTDSAVVARGAGVTLLVVRAGEQTVQDVSLAVKRLVQNGASATGAVLNHVRFTLGRYGRSGGYRRYETPRS